MSSTIRNLMRGALSILMMSFSCSSAHAAEKPVFIPVNTDNSSMIMAVGPERQLLFRHFGGKISCAEDFEGYKSWRRNDYGTDPLAYPASGGRYFNDAALTVRQSDGDMNTELKYVSHSVSDVYDGIFRTEINLADDKGVQVKLIYTAYPEEDVIVMNSEISNAGKEPVTLINYYSASLPVIADKYYLTHFYGSWAREMQVDRELLTHGAKIIESKKGVRTTHTENPAFMISLNTETFDENYGEVIAGALAWSGNFKMIFQMDETSRLNILAGINPYASERRLEKGETFITPPMIFTYSSEGAGQASRNLHDWARRWWIHAGSNICPTLLNSWEGAYFDFSTRTITDMIDDTKEMGLEMFVLDDGWFGSEFKRDNDKQGLGDWTVNAEKLPEGIGYLADYAHKSGLKFGIWIEPEMVNPKSSLASEHPDWVVKADGREVTTIRNQWILDLSNPEVQDFVFGVFDSTMQLGDIDYIKWDANRHVESFGSEYLDDQNDFFVDYVQGFYGVMKRIREKYPDVMIQACASGGGRVEYGALKYFDEFWTSDNTEALSRNFIQYGTSMIYPAVAVGSHVSAVPNHQSGNITPLKFRFDVACSGRLGMELQPKAMTGDEKEFARTAIESYKTYRDLISSGDLYRIKSPYDSDFWSMMYVSKDKKRAVVFAYCLKYQGRTLIPQLRLYGLDPEKDYKVTELNVKKSSFWGSGSTFKGDYLIESGLNPKLVKIYDSAVFYLEAD